MPGETKWVSLMTKIASGTIHANLSSKANSRRFIRPGLIIKSKPAMAFMEAAALSIPQMTELYEGPVSLTAHVYYKTRKNDLSIELLMDALQGRVFQNDRQVEHIIATKSWDKTDPRIEWKVLKYDRDNT